MPKKFYDVHLGGEKMTQEQFEYLADNVLLHGVKHCYQAKKIEYDIEGNYSNARADMRAAEQWLKKQGYKPIKTRGNGDYYLTTENGDYHFHMTWGTYVSY